MNILYLIIGLSNAGKTTYSSKFKNVIHRDDFTCNLSHRALMSFCRSICLDDDLYIEGIYNTKRERKIFLNNIKADKYICIWIDTPLEECFKRDMRGRSREYIQYQQRVFEEPSFEEGWDEIWIVKGNGCEVLNETGI